MTDRLMSMRKVVDRLGLSKTELYRRINAGTFPRPVPISRHRIAFLESEVDEWMASRIREREGGEGADYRRARSAFAISARR